MNAHPVIIVPFHNGFFDSLSLPELSRCKKLIDSGGEIELF